MKNQNLTIHPVKNGFVVVTDTNASRAPTPAPPMPSYEAPYSNVHVFNDAESLAEFVKSWGKPDYDQDAANG